MHRVPRAVAVSSTCVGGYPKVISNWPFLARLLIAHHQTLVLLLPTLWFERMHRLPPPQFIH